MLIPCAHWLLRFVIKRHHVLACAGLRQSLLPEATSILSPLRGGTLGTGAQSPGLRAGRSHFQDRSGHNEQDIVIADLQGSCL